MPAGAQCVEYASTPYDNMPRLAEAEIVYFFRDDCDHCRNIRRQVAAWVLQLPEPVFYQSTIADFDHTTTGFYQIGRVPAFVVNRRYRVELATSDPATVAGTLDIVRDLARPDASR